MNDPITPKAITPERQVAPHRGVRLRRVPGEERSEDELAADVDFLLRDALQSAAAPSSNGGMPLFQLRTVPLQIQPPPLAIPPCGAIVQAPSDAPSSPTAVTGRSRASLAALVIMSACIAAATAYAFRLASSPGKADASAVVAPEKAAAL